MIRAHNRRDFLRHAIRGIGGTMLGAGVGLPLASAIRAQPAGLSAQTLRGDLRLLTGAGGNVVMLGGTDGVALVDSGGPEHAAQLGEAIQSSAGGASAELLLNTHWHIDHTGGNDMLGAAGIPIIAHENTRLWMSTQYYVDWQDRTYQPRAAAALPTRTFYESDPQPLTVEFGGEKIEAAHLREAHTDGDIYVRFPEHNVIAVGGVMTSGYPILDYATGGWIGGLMDATEKLLGLSDADTLFVPASGPAQPRSRLQAQFEMIGTVRERIENMMRKGKSAREMIAAGVTEEFDAHWGADHELFVTNIYNGLWWQGRLNGSL